MKSFISILINTLHFESDSRPIVAKRWIVSRPYDVRTRTDACPLLVRRAP